MADSAQPIVIQQGHGFGAQILVGAVAGVITWWLIETITKAREDAAAAAVDDE